MRKNVSVILGVVVEMSLGLSQPAHAENWQLLYANSSARIDIDIDSIQRRGDVVSFRKIMTLGPDITDNIITKPNGESVAIAITYSELQVNCSTKRGVSKKIVFFDQKQNVLAVEGETQYVDPSIRGIPTAAAHVCASTKPR